MAALAQKRMGSLGLLVVVALCAALAIAVIRSQSSNQTGTSAGDRHPGVVDDPVMRLFDPEEALIPTGTRVSVAAAEARTGREIYLPSDESAAAVELWIDQASSDVAVRLGGDLVVTFEAWEPGQVPAASYADSAKEWGVGEATEIGGYPAWVVPQDAQSEGHPPVNVVHVAVGGWDVTLFGRGTMDELLVKARTLSPAT